MKKVTSIKIDKGLWKKVKKHCIDEEIDISKYIERLVEKDLGKWHKDRFF